MRKIIPYHTIVTSCLIFVFNCYGGWSRGRGVGVGGIAWGQGEGLELGVVVSGSRGGWSRGSGFGVGVGGLHGIRGVGSGGCSWFESTLKVL